MRSATGRLVLKWLQLLATSLLIVILSKLGTQWILLIGSLLVPPFGIYMILRSPDRQKHLLPYQTYMAVAAGRRWLRVDAVLCASMFIAFTGFALILFLGANKTTYPAEARLLSLAGLCGLVAAACYGLNCLLSLFHLRIGTIDFSTAMINHAKLGNPMKVCSMPNGQTPLPLHIDTLDRFHQSPLPFPDDTLVRNPKNLPSRDRDWELPSYFQIVSIPRVQSLSKERPVIDAWSGGKRLNDYQDCRHFGINMVPSDGSPEPFQVYDVPSEARCSPRVMLRRIGERFDEPPPSPDTPKPSLENWDSEEGSVTRISVSTTPSRPIYASTQATVSTLVAVNDYSTSATVPNNSNPRIRVIRSPRDSPNQPAEANNKNEPQYEKIQSPKLSDELVADV